MSNGKYSDVTELFKSVVWQASSGYVTGRPVLEEFENLLPGLLSKFSELFGDKQGRIVTRDLFGSEENDDVYEDTESWAEWQPGDRAEQASFWCAYTLCMATKTDEFFSWEIYAQHEYKTSHQHIMVRIWVADEPGWTGVVVFEMAPGVNIVPSF